MVIPARENLRTPLSAWCLSAVALGLVLRLIWPADMEWKYDERWMFAHGLEIASGQAPLPWVGMASGAKGLVNPGFSVWPFALAAKWFPNPVGVGLFVMGLNALALVLMAVGVKRGLKTGAPWAPLSQWALAFLALSPMAILYSRKIWAQDLLLFFLAVAFLGALFRHRFWGSFLFALMVGLACQIHMSALFLAASVGLAILARAVWKPRRFSWNLPGLLVGLVPAAVGLTVWFASMGHHPSGGFHLREYATNLFSFKWLMQGIGAVTAISLKESLGGNWKAFLAFPSAGIPLWLPVCCLVAMAGALVWGHTRRAGEMKRAVAAFWRERSLASFADLLGNPFFTAVVLTGLLLTGTGINIQPHYLILIYPVLFLWPAWILKEAWAKRLFLVASGVLSLCFLVYIHVSQGAPQGDYGLTYRAQMEQIKPPSPR